MTTLELIVSALTQGQSVRRENWLPDVRMFLQGNSLMHQSGSVKPRRCALSWNEIVATDWLLAKDTPVTLQVYQTPTERQPLLLVEELALPRSFDQVRWHFNLRPTTPASKTG